MRQNINIQVGQIRVSKWAIPEYRTEMAPGNLKQFEQNLAEIRQGPLPDEEMQFMRNFGDVVYGRKQ